MDHLEFEWLKCQIPTSDPALCLTHQFVEQKGEKSQEKSSATPTQNHVYLAESLLTWLCPLDRIWHPLLSEISQRGIRYKPSIIANQPQELPQPNHMNKSGNPNGVEKAGFLPELVGVYQYHLVKSRCQVCVRFRHRVEFFKVHTKTDHPILQILLC